MLPSLAPGVHRLNLLERPTEPRVVCGRTREETALVEAGRGEGGKEWGMGSQEEGWEKHPKHSANTPKGW